MVNTIRRTLKCPKCGLVYQINLTPGLYRFFIFRCPSCTSNVVAYKNKIDIISDTLMCALFKEKRVKLCGDLVNGPETGISEKQIQDLHRLLQKEKYFEKIISQL